MTVLLEQRVRIGSRVTAFTVVCDGCAQEQRDAYAPCASVSGTLPLERCHGSVECRRGHTIVVEREVR
jgi:hypothetical protein